MEYTLYRKNDYKHGYLCRSFVEMISSIQWLENEGCEWNDIAIYDERNRVDIENPHELILDIATYKNNLRLNEDIANKWEN